MAEEKERKDKKQIPKNDEERENLFEKAREKRETHTQRFRRSLTNAEIISDYTVEALMRRNRTKKVLQYIGYALFALLFCFIFIVACFSLFFRTEHVTVSGADHYAAEDIIAGSGITVGENIYATSRAEVKATLTHRFPYVAGVVLTRYLPDTVALRIVEEQPSYFAEIYGEYFVLSSQLRVLERSDSRLVLQRRALTELKLTRVKKAIVGEMLEFDQESYYTFLSSYLASYENSDLYETGQIVYIDLSDKFGVEMVYGDRFEINIGSSERLDSKLLIAYAIISQYYGEGEEKARIDVTEDPSYAIAIDTISILP